MVYIIGDIRNTHNTQHKRKHTMSNQTTTAKKANRGHLLRAAIKGQLFVKCNGHYTDDYRHDMSTNYGIDDDFCGVYMQPYFCSECFDDTTDERMDAHSAFCDAVREMAQGRVVMTQRDFKAVSGGCWGTTENGSFRIHSNLGYGYEIRK